MVQVLFTTQSQQGHFPLPVFYVILRELLINKIYMAKRRTGVGKHKKTHSHKTKKRLGIKRLMLEAKANKKT